MAFANRVLARLHRIPDAFERLLGNRRTTIAWVGGIVGVCLWIGWAIHVGNTNGWTAALGVLITWPLIASLIGLVVGGVVGSRRMLEARRAPRMPAIAGAGPPPKLPKGHDSVTTLTFPS